MLSPRVFTASLPLLCASALACSGGGGGGGAPEVADAGNQTGGGDGGAQIDAGTVPLTCTPVNNFTDLGAIDGDVFANAQEEYLSIDAVLDVGPPGDLLVIELFGGYGVMTDGLKTGTFTISGDETNYNTCGVCVTVLADLDPDVGPSMVYSATSGTVTITSIEGNFAGSFVPDGASTTMVGATFNTTSNEFETRSDCSITGAGMTWDKAIPAATPQPNP